MTNNKSKNKAPKTANFSKDSPIIETSSKQEQVNTQNVQVPIKQKETKK